jgi:hypothetical protein
MPKTDVTAVVQKWSRNMNAATPTIKAGVLALQENPMEKAAQRGDAYVAGVQRAKDSGKWAAGLRRKSFDAWKRATAEKGTARIAAGVSEALPDYTSFMAELLPYTAQTSAEVKRMPKGSDEDSKARMLYNFERMKAFRSQRRS